MFRAKHYVLGFLAIILVSSFFASSILSDQPRGASRSPKTLDAALRLLGWPTARSGSLRDRNFNVVSSARRAMLERVASVGDQVSLTIFCAPKPYEEEIGENQRRAIRSWLRLSNPSPKIVLMGNDSTFYIVAKEYPLHVTVEPYIETNFQGLPQYHSLIARAMAADSDVSLYLNADIILLPNVYTSIVKLQSTFDAWLMTGMRWDLGEREFPFDYRSSYGKSFGYSITLVRTEPDGGATDAEAAYFKPDAPVDDVEVLHYVEKRGVLHSYGGMDFWAWNNVREKNGGEVVPLHRVGMPPFGSGRGRFDNWIIHEAVASELRAVVDATETATSIHVKHGYGHVADKSASEDGGKNFWSANKKRTWEAYLNVHMSQQIGSGFKNQLGTAQHIPWRLSKCFEPVLSPSFVNGASNAPAAIHGGAPMPLAACLLHRLRPGVCKCEYSPFVHKSQQDPSLRQLTDNVQIWQCGDVSIDQPYALKAVPDSDAVPGLPHTLDHLIPVIADADRAVILTGATFQYRHLLMNLICNLKKVGVSNYIIAAFDEDMYKYGAIQGLPIYLEPSTYGLPTVASENCSYSTPCFAQYTKMKSRAVLRLLAKGFNVLWTDTDVVWFQNALELLKKEVGVDSMVIQSNQPDISAAPNHHRRLNSGFYFVPSSEKTIRAFEEIVALGEKSEMPEQPVFYDVLCGPQGENKVENTQCNFRGLRVKTLDLALYPNGRIHGLWDENGGADTARACRRRGCVVLHNNWVSGIESKISRLKSSGLWLYDSGARMCIHPWHKDASGVRL